MQEDQIIKFGYSLRAIVSHIGIHATSGHYVSFIQNNSKWYMFNDTIVKEVSAVEVLDQQAYIMFYERRNQHATEVSQLFTS